MLLTFSFCFGLFLIADSQSAYFTKYSEKDGLSSNHVYKVFQDSKGYIWFATSKGATRFDSENFKVFGTTDGLTDYEVVSMYEDSSSRIWLATFNGLPCYYKDGEIYNYENDPLLKGIELKDYIKSIFEDSDNNIWLASRNKTVKLNYKENTVEQYDLLSYMIHENSSKEVILHQGMNKQVNISKDPGKIEEIPLGNSTSISTASGISAQKMLMKDGLLFAIQNKFYFKSLKHDTLDEILPENKFSSNSYIRNIEVDDDNIIYIATTEGAYIYKLDLKNKRLLLQKTFFAGRNITSFNIDHQKGLWISSQNGVYHYKNDEVLKLNEKIGAVNLLNRNEKFLVLAEPNNKISVLDIENAKIIKTFVTKTEPKSIENINGQIFIITEIKAFQLVDNELVEIIFNHSVKDLDVVNGNYVLATHSGIFYGNKSMIDNGLLSVVKLRESEAIESIFNKRVFKLFKIDQFIYASTVDGILIFDELLNRVDTKISTSNFRPNDIISFDNSVVISTYQDGIYIYDNTGSIDTVNIYDGLMSNQIIKTIKYRDRLYVVTGEGVQYLDSDFKPINILGLSNLDTKINGAELIDDNIILATVDGILSYDLRSKIDREMVYKSDIVILRNENRISNLDTLDYSDNSIEIQFQVFDYAKINENLKYRLYPESKDWKPVNAKQIRYQGLQPDAYVFQLKDGDIAIEETSFYIKKPIWMKIWFRVMSGLFLLSLIYFYLRYRFGKILKKKEKDFAFNLKLATAEQEALKAQMNPHFIFNSLNAIQNLILNERTDQAYKYLGDFSKLVRKVLLDSRNINTTVQREIDFLTLYMKLEELRFENQFNYTFEYEDNFNMNQIIPSMVLQPFVENAIIHGLIPKNNKENSEIVIKFKEDNEFLFCQICDNGIGYESIPNSRIEKDSLGLKIIKERLELFDSSGQSYFTTESSKSGTVINLQLKKSNESNHNRR